MPVEKRIKEYFKAKGISTLYPPQVAAIKTGVLDGNNVVLAIPTASGKTLIAELCMLKTILERGGKALYLCPLRALASEKYDEFSSYAELGVKVGITTGDYDSVEEKYGTYDLLICTNERADSLLRHRAKWMSEIAIVIADEVHLINDPSRGPTLEVVLARLRQIAPAAQILALSATVDNAQELAAWLNGQAVISDWRPVTLREGVYYAGKVVFGEGNEEPYFPATSFPIGDITRSVLKEQGQLLAFLNTRRSAVQTAQKLSSIVASRLTKLEQQQLNELADKLYHLGEVTQVTETLTRLIRAGVTFHHAGLRYSERKLIEDAFRKNLIKVVCATPTLCLGPQSKIWHGLDETAVTQLDKSIPLYALSNTEFIPLKPDKIVSVANAHHLLEFTSLSGYCIQVTPNHRMLAKRNNKRMILPASAVRRSDKIATARRVKPETILTCTLKDYIIANSANGRDSPFDAALTYFLGLMLGAGSSGAERKATAIQYPGSPSITGLDAATVSRIEHLCTQLGVSTRRTPSTNGGYKLVLGTNAWFQEFLVRCGVENPNQRFMDPKLLKLEDTLVSSLLRGLFDATAIITQGHEIRVRHPSARLVKQIQKLLLRFGIVSRRPLQTVDLTNDENNGAAVHPCYELVIDHSQCLLDFQTHIGFGVSHKQAALEAQLAARHTDILGATLEKRLRKSRQSSDLEDDIYWDTIHDIKIGPVPSQVFDVVLPNRQEHDHLFVADGFIVHNSAGVNLPARVVIIKEYRRYDRIEGYQPIPVLEYKQMAGRAGRPKYDTTGTAILISRDEGEREFLLDYYILGSPENILSKLANESALRSHVLSTIAMNYASDKKGIMDFIRQTFFGHQRDPDEVEYMIDLILRFLKEEALLAERGKHLSATPFGRRVSQLYIDPKSAVTIRDGLAIAAKKLDHTTDFSFLHLICHTPDMANLYLRRGEDERFHDYVLEHGDEFLLPIPDPRYNRDQYDFFLAEVKTALLAKAWIEELPEDQLIGQFKIGSGDLLRLVETQAWLLYSCREIAPIFGHQDVLRDLEEIELRVKYGVKRELTDLVELHGIGRVRARFLFRAGFVSKAHIRDGPLPQLASVPTIGPQIAQSIKLQCGGIIKSEEEQALKASERQNTKQTQLTLD